jgi:hypothetical protein
MKRLAFFTVMLFCIVFIAHMATGQVAKKQVVQDARFLEYEGVLTGTTGEKLTGEYLMMFHVYDTKTSGLPLWEENHRVTVKDGEFRVTLGKKSRLPISDARAYYVSITINEEVLSPRQLFTVGVDNDIVTEGSTPPFDDTDVVDPPVVVPYGVGGGWTDDGTVVRLTTVSDLVGIGTTDPQCKLDVIGEICGGYSDTVNAVYGGILSGFSNLAGDAATDTAAFVGGGSDNSATAKYATVGGGRDNTASSNYATVAGGSNNSASDSYAIVAGGRDNTASANYGTVAGGHDNTASGSNATVGGGYEHEASSWAATVGGGWANTASGSYATVGGGANNSASNLDATVGGGSTNSASGWYATVGGGQHNSANGYYATVGGGHADTVNTRYGGVAAGYSNLAGDAATDTAAFVGGGLDNSAIGKYSTVGGGYSNTASGDRATVGGGRINTATDWFATVGGGEANTASGSAATVSGGYNNTASNLGATAGGGYNNTATDWYATVGGGYNNEADGYAATVGGGYNCDSDGDYSFTVGNDSNVPSSYSNSAAFNGQTATASSQTRVGTISKAAGTFTIDHPTQPLNRIMNHYFVESPEMVLIYRGVAIIGSEGRAEVQLPDYFDALNRNPMVQLTGVGTSDVYVSDKVSGNRFVIGGKPGTEVYWTVTGDRKDQSAEITRILMPVEQLKEGDLAGHSLDDDFLAATMSQLERMGEAGKFNFRTAEGQEKYERSLRAREEAGPTERE